MGATIDVWNRALPDGGILLQPCGDVDLLTAGALLATLLRTIKEGTPAHVVVDLDQVTFMDSSGLRVLVVGYKAAQQAKIGFTVVRPRPGVFRALAATGLSNLFGVPEPATEAELSVR